MLETWSTNAPAGMAPCWCWHRIIPRESWAAVQQGLMTPCVSRSDPPSPDSDGRLEGQWQRFICRNGAHALLCEGIRDAMQRRSLTILFPQSQRASQACFTARIAGRCRSDACSVALTFSGVAIRCAVTAGDRSRADQCPGCQSSLEPVGLGTERIEEAVRQIFPRPVWGVWMVRRFVVRRTPGLQPLLHAGNRYRDRHADAVFGWRCRRRSFVAVPDADAGLHVPGFPFSRADKIMPSWTPRNWLSPAAAEADSWCRPVPGSSRGVGVRVGQRELFLAQEQAFRHCFSIRPGLA